jgi:hypothetical protein
MYAYELNLLGEDESRTFEGHLYECEHCFERVRRFEGAVNLLRHDSDVLAELKTVAEEDADSLIEDKSKVDPVFRHSRKTLTRYLLAAVLVLVVGVPLYHFSSREAVQHIDLTPMRDSGAQTLFLEPGGTVRIRIAIETTQAGGAFNLVLHTSDGDTVYSDLAFTGFDGTGRATLELPVGTFTPGYQLLTIEDPTGTYLESPVNFVFRVE